MQTYLKHTLLAALLMALLGAPPNASANIVIDFASAMAVDGYSQATMDAISQTTFYFEHASVGSNMTDGLRTLHAANAGFYQLATADVSSPPGTSTPGTVYEFARGNPNWTDKVADFASRITTDGIGIIYVLNKFCWIDEQADWSVYAASIAALETANPGTTFVYMAMPLTPDSDYANVLRNQFNAGLRTWAAANDKILFDVADIEAHNASGTLQTFDYNGSVYERMASEWTSDGGHPDSNGSDALLARGFYALAAETAVIPEPATFALSLGAGTLGLAFWRCRRREQT